MQTSSRFLRDNFTASGLFKVSQSKVEGWRTCRQKFWYQHIMHIERRRKPRPLTFGTIMHQMKEAAANGKDPYQVLKDIDPLQIEMFEEEREYYGNIVQDITYIYNAYVDFWEGKELVYLKHRGRRAEFPFEVEHDGFAIKGTIDAITEFRNYAWLTEHKNHKDIPNSDQRWRNVQSAVYLRVIDMLGWWKNVQGTCWDYIRTKPPTRPKILKSGEVSERSLDSLPEVVIDTIEAAGRNIKNYSQMIDAQQTNMHNWFQRIYTPIKKQIVNNVWDDFLDTARDMRRAKLSRQQVRTIGRHCGWCQFEPLCRAELQGLDVEAILEYEYTESTYEAEGSEAK